jgi:ferrous iron transport protein A
MKSDFNSSLEPAPLSLADLAPGTEGMVVEVCGHDPASRRLLDLGLLAGTHVRVLRRAPLGDPVIYELRGYRLCLRRSDAARVRIRVESPAAAIPTP